MKSFILAMLLAVMTVSPGWAAEGLKLERVTRDKASNKCVGRNDTPRCALHTLIACARGLGGKICKDMSYAFENEDDAAFIMEYIILNIGVVTEKRYNETIKKFPQLEDDLSLPGTPQARVLERACWEGSLTECKWTDWKSGVFEVQYILRKKGWVFASISVDEDIISGVPYYFADGLLP
jgi:hypothetical protein